MNRMKKWNEILRNLTMVGQLGLSLIMPLLMCLAACYLLCAKLHAPGWIYIPGFILGIGGSATTGWKVYKSVTGKENGKKDQNGPSFNRHY